MRVSANELCIPSSCCLAENDNSRRPRRTSLLGRDIFFSLGDFSSSCLLLNMHGVLLRKLKINRRQTSEPEKAFWWILACPNYFQARCTFDENATTLIYLIFIYIFTKGLKVFEFYRKERDTFSMSFWSLRFLSLISSTTILVCATTMPSKRVAKR